MPYLLHMSNKSQENNYIGMQMKVEIRVVGVIEVFGLLSTIM